MNMKSKEYNVKMKIISNFTYEGKLSDDLIKLMVKSINQNRDKFENNSVSELKSFLSKEAYVNVQKSMLINIINQHNCFNLMNMDCLSIIKHHIELKSDYNVFKINSIASELFFVIEGNIQLFDSTLNLCGEYEVNDILGIKELNEYLHKNNILEDFDDNSSINTSIMNTSKKDGKSNKEEEKKKEEINESNVTVKRTTNAIAKEKSK